jgi:hypothetical protein
MNVLELVREASIAGDAELNSAARCPDGLRVDFPAEPSDDAAWRVLKTHTRQITSCRHGTLQAREIVRVATTPEGRCVARSRELAQLAPPGCRYAYDLIVEVGLATLLEGRQLGEVAQELSQQRPSLVVPPSTLWQLQRRFLFYFGVVHRQAMPVLREHLAKRGGYTALLDGTCEAGSPVLFGVTEAEERMTLGSWKLPSENVADVRRCLAEVAAGAGPPSRLLHDLSGPLGDACDQEFPGIAQRVCHFHFARDVGSDLYERPQGALVSALRRHKLVTRLHDQRKGQVRRLADAGAKMAAGPATAEAYSWLARWRAGEESPPGADEDVGRQVLVAFHHWLLDYAHVGTRQGFPFDPYLLYQHRRWRQGELMLRELLADPRVQGQASRGLKNLQRLLGEYLSDPAVVTALTEWEAREGLFGRLRIALRLNAVGPLPPLSDPQTLSDSQERDVAHALDSLKHELAAEPSDPAAQIVLKHLRKYEGRLVVGSPEAADAESLGDGGLAPGVWSDRTNNKREAGWRELKRNRRRVHGRGKLGQDLEKLPAEWGLVPNLRNPRYVELVLGSLDQLPLKFAEAATVAGSYYRWLRQQSARRPGQVSKRELRTDTFLDDLGVVYAEHCATAAASGCCATDF